MATHKKIVKKVYEAYENNKRMTAPLMGFPGVSFAGTTIKVAQQNYWEHYKIVKFLAEKFRPDLIFPLMDLAVEVNALGQYTLFPENDSPTVVKGDFELTKLSSKRKINITSDTRMFGYVKTVELMSINLSSEIAIGAYVTGPYTIAALMMGADEAAMATLLSPEQLSELCNFATEKILEYIRLLITAGVQVICILEPSAVMLGATQFNQFSGSFVKRITEFCADTDVAIIYHVCGNSMHLIGEMVKSGVDILSLDSPQTGVNILDALQEVPMDVVVMGNINPTGNMLNGTPESVAKEVVELLNITNPFPNFIVSTGCDLPQKTPMENISTFINTVRNYKIPEIKTS